jgi:hypothetical protein
MIIPAASVTLSREQSSAARRFALAYHEEVALRTTPNPLYPGLVRLRTLLRD